MNRKILIAAALMFCLALPASGAAMTSIGPKDCKIVQDFFKIAKKGTLLAPDVLVALTKYSKQAKPSQGKRVKNCFVLNRCSFQPSCQDIESRKENYTIFITNHMRYIVDFNKRVVLNVTQSPKSNL